MKKTVVALLLVLALVACKDKNAYTITGKVAGLEGAHKLVVFGDPEETEIIDSTLIKNGAFQLEGIAGVLPRVAFLSVKNESNQGVGRSQILVLEPGAINVDINETKVSVTGTELNDKNAAFEKEMDGLDPSQHIQNMQAYIESNIANPLGAFYFTVAFPIFQPEEIKSLLDKMPEELKSSEKVSDIKAQLEELEKASFVGKKFTDIKGLTVKGKEIKLSDYAGKGKIVLVDFWASWCPPCINDMPHLKGIYEKYKDQGFEIVGVSLDESTKDWEAAIKKLGLTWPQFLNGEEEGNGAVTYNVRSIPFTLMIDKEGTIVAERLRGDKIADKIEELLK